MVEDGKVKAGGVGVVGMLGGGKEEEEPSVGEGTAPAAAAATVIAGVYELGRRVVMMRRRKRKGRSRKEKEDGRGSGRGEEREIILDNALACGGQGDILLL